jgi:hypothetical protein
MTSTIGNPNVLAPVIYQPDWKFLNPFNWFARYDNTPLENLLSSNYYWYDENRSPLMTFPDKGEPRLLLISVDIQDCSTAVTFDSFPKDKKFSKCITIYGDDDFKYTTEYDGITPEHVTTSMSTHQKYRYLHFPVVKEDKTKTKENKTIEERYFWDGAYLSNTPLREVIQHHRDYWHNIRNEKQVPDLEVYIVNLYPRTEKSIDNVIIDSDLIQDREIVIKFHDRTNYDKISELTNDYVDLVTLLIDRSLEHAANREALLKEFNNIFKSTKTRSRKRSGNDRKFSDLIDGRFRITRVGKVERPDDGYTIFGKAFEFSHATVNNLRENGYKDGRNAAFKETG